MRTKPPIRLLSLMVLVALPLLPRPAAADSLQCRREIARAAAKLADARLAALQRCRDAVLTGKSTGPCPDAKASAKIVKAGTKLQAAIARRCGGADQDCGTTGDNEALSAIGWNVGNCPGIDGGSCGNAIANCNDVAACVRCVGETTVDQGLGLVYDDLASTSDKTVTACQRTLGKESTKFLRAARKALAKCEDGRMRGTVGGSCPDAIAGAAIAKAEAKRDAKICGACGGGDRACGGGDDLAPATIGFPSSCPDVQPPGAPSCDAAVGSLPALVTCVGCVSEFASGCGDAVAVPSLQSYPNECRADAGGAVCGNGVSESPEQCDGGDDAACPGLCQAGCTCGAPCGNGVVDAGEQCDGANAAQCPGSCAADCTCPCTLPSPIPQVVSFAFLPGLDSDSGWTGIIDDVPYTNNAPFGAASLAGCDTNLSSPTCGQCTIGGNVQFPGQPKNCRCINLGSRDASSRTICDPTAPSCSGAETCECFNGPILPVSSGGAPVCIINRFTQPVTGTINIALTGPHAGESATSVRVESAVHNGLELGRPCPSCEGDPVFRDGIPGGTCNGGIRNGQPCDVAATHDLFGTATFDCPPSVAANIGNLDIRIPVETTGQTVLTRGTKCTGQAGLDCACNTCATAAAEPCNANADCPGGAICGGRRCIGGPTAGVACTQSADCGAGGLCNRPGEPSRQNACLDGVCSPNPSDTDNANEGVCEAGPIDRLCSIETFRSCNANDECNPPPAGSCPECAPGQECLAALRQCFLDPIVRTGTRGRDTAKVAAAYCIGPVASQSINQVTGLPGPGTVVVPLRKFFGPATCGNGALDATEQCDPPQDAACAGECQPDCRCPTAVCGDSELSPPEQCDGGDDAACPGACQADCTCGTFCGDGTLDAGESCDDGNTTDGDGCDSDCTATGCGNGIRTSGEECDGNDAPTCSGHCQVDCTCGPFCGDGAIDAGEQCDGAATGTCAGTCEGDCTCAAFCGNGVREGSELCDAGDAAACPGDCAADCTCPSIGNVTLVVRAGADLDAGWTGTSHDFPWQVGATIPGEIGGCAPPADPLCTFFANVGSYCSGDPSRNCTQSSQCAVGQTCQLITYGPPLGLSSGGVPACAIPRFSKDITGTFNVATGAMSFELPASVTVFLGTDVNFPCPYCDCGAADPHDCQLGDPGTCSSNPLINCTVEGTGPFGPTSNACQPTGAEVTNGGLDLSLKPATTDTSTFPSNTPCAGNGFSQYGCWGAGQTQPNSCLTACDGGSNDAQACNDDGDCPGAPAGACTALCRQIVGEDVGEGFCPAGPISQTCAGAPQISCSSAQPCPLGVGPCVAAQQRCFLDPIVRVGVAGLATNVIAGTFFVPATSSPAINQVAGLPGPAGIKLPHDVTIRYCGDGSVNRLAEECDGSDDDNCPGACNATTCTCSTTCGNDTIEFGEQCDGTADAACPTLCNAPGGPNQCECPALCGDGFLGAGEQCDPGGTPPGTPANDAACPGECLPTCQCQPPVCGDGVIEGAEVCELPTLGCGPLQICVACTQCAP
jgi:cysteine-rich repeat protein